MMIVNKDLENLINKEINGIGFVLVDLELDKNGSDKILRIFVDNLNDIDPLDLASNVIKKGITVEECGKISRHLSKFIGVLPNLNDYMLEVSSPGLERKLSKLSQFTEQLGKEIKVQLRIPIEGRNNFIGVLLDVKEELNKIFVEIDKQRICLDYDNIAKANLVYRKL